MKTLTLTELKRIKHLLTHRQILQLISVVEA